jgi:hypothetical protein
VQTIGTAAAALIIAFSAPSAPAIAGSLATAAGTARVVAMAPAAAGPAATAAVSGATAGGGSSNGGLVTFRSVGGGGLSNHGETHVAVQDGPNGPTILGVDLYGYVDPNEPGTFHEAVGPYVSKPLQRLKTTRG